MPEQPPERRADNPVWYTQPHPEEYSYNPGYGFFQKSPAATEKAALRRYAMGIAASVLGYMALMTLLPLFFSALLRFPFVGEALPASASAQALYYIISSAVFVLALGIPFAIYGLAIEIPRPVALPTARRPDPGFVLPAICVGLGLSVIGRLFMVMLSLLLSAVGLESAAAEPYLPTAPVSFIFCALGLTLVPALLEEFVMRGVVMQSLRRFGDGFALLASSVLFMLLHQNLLQYPNALLMGLFIGYAVLYTGSIWTGVALHLTNNLSVLTLMALERWLGLPMPAVLLCYGVFLIIALLALVFLIRRSPALFCIAPSRALHPFAGLVRLFYGTPMVMLAILALFLAALQGMRVMT